MEEFRKTIILLIFGMMALIALILTGIFLINWISQPKEVVEVTEVDSRTVIEEISDQYFVVTKTLLLNEEVEIVVDEGSSWSNIWWGDQINAEADMRVDIGVDMTDLTDEDINIDQESRVITINVPDAEVLTVSLNGEIEVTSEKGIIRRFFQNDSNRDYNLALEQLRNEASESALSREDVVVQAQEDSVRVLDLIIENLDYELEISEEFDSENEQQ